MPSEARQKKIMEKLNRAQKCSKPRVKRGPWIRACKGAYYRPQTKFAKVMFLQVSVCPQEGVGGGHAWWGTCMAGRAVRILLECILVYQLFVETFSQTVF